MEIKPNNIYNVDCYEAIKSMADDSVDLVYIDIPYLYGNCDSKNKISPTKSAVSNRLGKRNIELRNIINGIDYSIFDELCRVMKKINIFIWCSKEQIHDIMTYFIDEKDCYFNMLVWCKTNPVPATNNNWLPDIEYCLVFREKGAPRYNDGYELKSKWYVTPINKDDKDLYDHPTIKPLELVERHIKHACNENDVVLDCFLGSGTTAVACQQTNRQYIGFEIDPTYFKIAQDRLNGVSQVERREQEKNKANGVFTIDDFL